MRYCLHFWFHWYRRLSKDYEVLPETVATFIYAARMSKGKGFALTRALLTQPETETDQNYRTYTLSHTFSRTRSQTR